MKGRSFRWALAVPALLSLVVGVLPAHAERSGTFPGDVGEILFQSDRDGDTEIYMMNLDGSGQTNLTAAPGSDERRPAADPLNLGFMFSSDRDGDFAIFFQTWDGTVTKLTNPTGGDFDIEASFSPDGSTIVFQRWDQSASLFQINVAPFSGEPVQLTTTYHDSNPQWSPDGQTIMFTREISTDNHDLYFTFPDLSGVGFFRNQATDDSEPMWSPDGSTVYYHSDNGATMDIFSATYPGAVETQLSNTGDMNEYGPVPAPDGTWLLYEQVPIGGDGQLILRDLLGGGDQQLTTLGSNGFADWIALPVPSTLTLTVNVTSSKVKVGGAVEPNAVGQEVLVMLLRKSGGSFHEVSHKYRSLSADSRYKARFNRPNGGKCKIFAEYFGDSDQTGAFKSKKFSC